MARIEAVLATCVYACSRIEIATKCELHLVTLTLIEEYLEAAGHRQDPNAPLTRPVKKNMRGHILTVLAPDSIYFDGVLKYLNKPGISEESMGPHVMRGHGRAPCAGLWGWTLRRCRSGWGMPTFRPRRSKTTARRGRK